MRITNSGFILSLLLSGVFGILQMTSVFAQDELKAVPKMPRFPDPIILGLQKAVDYDIYRDEVIIQVVYYNESEATVLFLPTKRSKQAEGGKSAPNWKLEVVVPYDEKNLRFG
jgi:hypothetical protein